MCNDLRAESPGLGPVWRPLSDDVRRTLDLLVTLAELYADLRRAGWLDEVRHEALVDEMRRAVWRLSRALEQVPTASHGPVGSPETRFDWSPVGRRF